MNVDAGSINYKSSNSGEGDSNRLLVLVHVKGHVEGLEGRVELEPVQVEACVALEHLDPLVQVGGTEHVEPVDLGVQGALQEVVEAD